MNTVPNDIHEYIIRCAIRHNMMNIFDFMFIDKNIHNITEAVMYDIICNNFCTKKLYNRPVISIHDNKPIIDKYLVNDVTIGRMTWTIFRDPVILAHKYFKIKIHTFEGLLQADSNLSTYKVRQIMIIKVFNRRVVLRRFRDGSNYADFRIMGNYPDNQIVLTFLKKYLSDISDICHG